MLEEITYFKSPILSSAKNQISGSIRSSHNKNTLEVLNIALSYFKWNGDYFYSGTSLILKGLELFWVLFILHLGSGKSLIFLHK